MTSTKAANTVPTLPAPVSTHETADPAARLIRSQEISAKAALALHTRTGLALKRFAERVEQAFEQQAKAVQALPATPWDAWARVAEYAVDFAQRSLIFGDTLRQRGNNFIEHATPGAAAGAALRLRDGDGRALARAPRQLRAGAHRAPAGCDGRCRSGGPT